MLEKYLSSQALSVIKRYAPDFIPKIGIILGSGLGILAEQITDPTIIPYEELPGFDSCKVKGHFGKLYLGYLKGTPVACLQGRAHAYEGTPKEAMRTPIRTLKLLGCDILLQTNAAGSINPDINPGHLMLITDHINFRGDNPLIGPNDSHFGPRFVGLEDAYNNELCDHMRAKAKDLNIDLKEGVYLGVSGPCFETPAEIRAFRALGADAAGMSTVPETIIARHCGLRVVAISNITNQAAGMSDQKLSHSVTLAGAQLAIADLQHLVMAFVEDLSNEPVTNNQTAGSHQSE